MNTQPAFYSGYTVKWADLPWEQQQAYALRRRVFCQEQQLFEGDDRDAIDDQAQLLVALGDWGGWHDQLVGTVRIHQPEAGVWWGSRLAVDGHFRRQGQIGSTLIRLAVSSAHALGCEQFLAHVQLQNETLFQRLHWHTIGQLKLHGQCHVVMQADLDFYPPCATPYSGFVARSRPPRASAIGDAWLQIPSIERRLSA